MKICGKNSVIERLRHNPKSIRKIYIQQGYAGANYIYKKAKQWKISVFVVPRSKILKLAKSSNPQGILIDIDDYEYYDYDELLDFSRKKKRVLIFLDGLHDPQNFGSILRTCASLGRFSIVLPTHNSVGVTEAVLRVASGGDNYIPIARVSNLANAVKKAQEAGFHLVGTVVKDEKFIMDVQLPYPLGLVIGSEQKGIRDSIKKILDLSVTIPMYVDTLSLNVAQATAIFCYEATKQQKKRKENK